MLNTPNKRSYILILMGTLLVSFLLGLYLSFVYPGVVISLDTLRYNWCKTTIEKVDYAESERFECGFSISKRYTKNAISFAELTPQLDKLKPGTILITSHGKSVCALIPGMWKHTMIYLGSQQQTKAYFGANSEFYKLLETYYITKNEYLMIDASFRQDVAIRCISKMANLQEQSTLRSLVCIEPKLSRQDNLGYINNAVKELGKKYDLSFDNSNDQELYCTEFIANALSPYGIHLQKQSKVLNRKISLPVDMVANILEDGKIDSFNYKFCLVKEANRIKKLSLGQFASLPQGH